MKMSFAWGRKYLEDVYGKAFLSYVNLFRKTTAMFTALIETEESWKRMPKALLLEGNAVFNLVHSRVFPSRVSL